MTNKVHVNDKMTKKERGFHSSQWCIYRNLPLFFGYPLHLFHCSRLVTAVVYVTSAFRGFKHQGWAKKTKKIRENTTFLRYKTNYSLLMKYCWGSGVFSDFEHSPLPYRCQERQTSRVVLVDSTLNPTLQRPKTTRRLPRPRVLRKITVRTANFWPNRCSKHATSSSTRHAEWWESHTYGACECYLVLERCGFSGPFALLDSQKPRSHAPSLQPFTVRFQPRTQGLFWGRGLGKRIEWIFLSTIFLHIFRALSKSRIFQVGWFVGTAKLWPLDMSDYCSKFVMGVALVFPRVGLSPRRKLQSTIISPNFCRPWRDGWRRRWLGSRSPIQKALTSR